AAKPLTALGQDTRPENPKTPPTTAPESKKCNTVIRFWRPGARSQIETFDPRPGRPNGGKAKAIDTAVKGLQISEYMPVTAKHMQHVALLRSMSFQARAHERAAP